MSTLIKGGTVVNPEGESGELDILLGNWGILEMSPNIPLYTANRVIDATGLMVAPGLVDTHVHFRDPGQTWKETIWTGGNAAKRGGFTSVVMMANTVPPIDNFDTLHYVHEEGMDTGINVYACANVTKDMKGEELTDMKRLYYEGAVGFSDDGKPILDEELLRKAMQISAELGVPISLHEEDPQYIHTPGFNRSSFIVKKLGIEGARSQAESSLIRRDLRIALETGAIVNIQHISTRLGVSMVCLARALSGKIHAEATPHHFSLTEEDAAILGTLAKMNPPLRTRRDQAAIVEALKWGDIDIIATDHAPHSVEEKASGLIKAPSGVIGLETSLALGITKLVRGGILTMEQLIQRMSSTPAKVYNLHAGLLAKGRMADLVIFDPNEKWTVTDDFASKSKNSPFIGWELYGKVKWTISAGRVVYSDQG